MDLPEKIAELPAVCDIGDDGLIGVVFAKSKSPSYAEAAQFAKRAKLYGESTVAQKLFHYAVFGLNKSQASLAIMVAQRVKAWKDTEFFLPGRVLMKNGVEETLKCYLDSLEVKDRTTHCHCVFRHLSPQYMNDFINETVKSAWAPLLEALQPREKNAKALQKKERRPEPNQYLIPCRLIHDFVENGLFIQGQPTPQHLHALAVRRGTFWCPNWDPSSFGRLAKEERPD